MMGSGPSSEFDIKSPEAVYWDSRYAAGGNSGYGSYGEQLEKKLKWISQLEGISSVLEVGCGDFNFGKNVLDTLKLSPQAYTGMDISRFIVERNKKLYPEYTFKTIENGTEFQQADLLLCIDVLFHIYDDKHCEELLQSLDRMWKKYLVLTAYERDEPLGGHVRIRKFDPSRFGTPIIREIVEEDGQLYFYVFKK